MYLGVVVDVWGQKGSVNEVHIVGKVAEYAPSPAFLGSNTRSTGPCLVCVLFPTEGQIPTHCDVLRVSPAKVFLGLG